MLDKFRNGLTEFIHTRTQPDYFTEILGQINLTHVFRQEDRENELLCLACGVVADAIIEERRNGMYVEVIKYLATTLCISLDIESERVCRGVVDINVVSEHHNFG